MNVSIASPNRSAMATETQTICQIPADRCRLHDAAQRPSVCSPSVPQFCDSSPVPPASFSTCLAERAIKEMLSAQQQEAQQVALRLANSAVQSLVGARKRNRKPVRPQRSWDDLPARSSCVSAELGTNKGERVVASKGSSPSPSHKRRKQGMSADEVLRAMQKIVKYRMQKRRFATKSSAFYKVYPVLFGHRAIK